MFDLYVGIDYSGAKAPVSRLPGLQVYQATPAGDAERVPPPTAGTKNWCRKELAYWLIRQLSGADRLIIGIDHGFSFPIAYMQRHALKTWPEFLDHFHALWPTDRDHMYIDFVRDNAPPSGDSRELRLCEQWTSSAKSVFQFDVQGSVAKSTHAGIAWLKIIRDQPGLLDNVHFWPFDGCNVPDEKSVIAETYPSMFRRRYRAAGRTADEQDAYGVAMWLKHMDGRGVLDHYFNPPLTLPERRLVELEGWILGVY